MEVVQALVDEEGESAERALGVDLSEVQFQIVGAAHVVVVGAHIATMEAAKAPASAATAKAAKAAKEDEGEQEEEDTEGEEELELISSNN